MATPADYDITERADQGIDQEEPSYFDVCWAHFTPPYMEAAATRYERRLCRELKVNEGQVLMHELVASDPQEALPAFQRCSICGEWVYNGRLAQRSWFASLRHHKPMCSDCSIPF